MGQVAVMGAGREGARWAEESAGGGRSLKRKSRHSGKFWFSDPMVRPDLVFGPNLVSVAKRYGLTIYSFKTKIHNE